MNVIFVALYENCKVLFYLRTDFKTLFKFLSMRIFSLIFITITLFISCTSPKTETQPQEAGSQQEPVSLNTRLKGAWQSLEDSMYHIHFEGEYYFSGYGEELDPASLFAIVDSCDASATQGEYLQVKLEDGTPMCYSISKLTETELELIYLSRGNTLRFVRR